MDSHIAYTYGKPRYNTHWTKQNRLWNSNEVQHHKRSMWNPTFHENQKRKRYNLKKRTSTTDNEFHAPELPGFSHVFGTSSSKIRRALWALILLSSIGLLIFIISKRIERFTDIRPTKETSTERSMKLRFPAISLCPAVFRYNPVLKRLARKEIGDDDVTSLFKLIDHGISLDNFWNMTNIYFDVEGAQIDTGRSIYRGLEFNKNMHKKLVSTPTGICTQLYSEKEIPDSYAANDVYIQVTLFEGADETDTSLYLYIHPLEDELTGKYFVGIKGQRTYFGSALVVNLKPFRKLRQNRADAKCDEASEVMKCQMDCLSQLLTKNSKKITCRMPFMPKEIKLPECQHSTEFDSSYKELSKFLQRFRLWDCNCSLACRWQSYNINYFSTQKQPNDSLLRIDIKMDYSLTIDREYWAYTFDAFLSDVGGNMGLFLGICLVTIVELLEFIILKIRQYLSI